MLLLNSAKLFKQLVQIIVAFATDFIAYLPDFVDEGIRELWMGRCLGHVVIPPKADQVSRYAAELVPDAGKW